MTCRRCGGTLAPFDSGLSGGPAMICFHCDLARKQWPERAARMASCPHQEIRRARMTPFLHQFDGTDLVIRRFLGKQRWLIVGDEMGVAKSKQVIDAACVLFVRGLLDRVIVLAPGGLRTVWSGPMGQLADHLWDGLPARVTEWHKRKKQWTRHWDGQSRVMNWIATNYEWVRGARAKELLPYCGSRTMIVFDESSALRNVRSQQYKACLTLRMACRMALELNGTPIAEGPEDAFGQANLLHPSILDCASKTEFRAVYGDEHEPQYSAANRPVMNKWGKHVTRVKTWKVDRLNARLAAHSVRRLKAECLDLPDKLDSVPILVPLAHSEWRPYKEMRDESVAWFGSMGAASLSPQAATKIMRLSQISSGFLGGVTDQTGPEIGDLDLDALLDGLALGQSEPGPPPRTEEIGRSKLDALLEFLESRLLEDANFKLLVFSRHRPEILRAAKELVERFAGLSVGTIIGGQRDAERERAKALLDPRTAPKGPAVVVASQKAGGKALTLTACRCVLYMSCGYELEARLQSEDRVHRQGQEFPVSYFDLVATGPNGQKTVDREIFAALAAKEDLAKRTMADWKILLSPEPGEGGADE